MFKRVRKDGSNVTIGCYLSPMKGDFLAKVTRIYTDGYGNIRFVAKTPFNNNFDCGLSAYYKYKYIVEYKDIPIVIIEEEEYV